MKTLEQQLLDPKTFLGGLLDTFPAESVGDLGTLYPTCRTVGDIRHAIRAGRAPARSGQAPEAPCTSTATTRPPSDRAAVPSLLKTTTPIATTPHAEAIPDVDAVLADAFGITVEEFQNRNKEDIERGAVPTPRDADLEEQRVWADTLEWVALSALREHPAWSTMFGVSADEDALLMEHVREHGVDKPLVVTGSGCAGVTDVLLDDHDHRVRRAAVRVGVERVPVIRRRDLDADAQEAALIISALASERRRKLKPSQQAALEARLHEIYAARGRGHRSDLKTCVGANGSSSKPGDTLDLVAADVGAPRNAVADRKKIFGSPISSPSVRALVDEGVLSPTTAAKLVRDVERRGDVAEALRKDWSEGEQILNDARMQVDEQARVQVDAPKHGRTKKRRTNEATIELRPDQHGQMHGLVSLDGVEWAIHVQGRELKLTRVTKPKSTRSADAI